MIRLSLLLLLLLPALVEGAAAPPPRRDLFGDPLPRRAIARLGTMRYRQGQPVTALVYSADGKWVASGGEFGSLYLWESRTGREAQRFAGHRSKVDCLDLSRDGKTLASLSDSEAAVRLWDTRTGKQFRSLTFPRAPVAQGRQFRLRLSSDGRTLVAAGWQDRTIIRWDVATGKELSKVRQGGS